MSGRRDRPGTTSCCNGTRNGISGSRPRDTGLTAIRPLKQTFVLLPVVSDARAGPRSDQRPDARRCVAAGRERRGTVGHRRSLQAGSREDRGLHCSRHDCAAGLFPTSVLLSAGYTEPLELLLVVLFFIVLKQQHYLSAALFAGLAVADRSTGIVLLPVLVWEMWRMRPEAVSCGPCAMRRSRDIGPLAVHAPSLEPVRGSSYSWLGRQLTIGKPP